ncbi:uncharacterized protein LOC131624866 [Vicia villosa]|uniref:uncharacterized protein LOC131624866 n=1 Tax=Vicia villosa TaxID=3911 RepID=UPI00273AC073|nr:uncharacterized protein LOC131624866 [Vicia villosa]
MAEKNKQKGTSSSLGSQIFESKICHPSAGIYGSIFSTHSPKILRRESVRFEASGSKTKKETVNSKVETQGIDSIFKNNNGGAHNTKNTDISCLYQNHNVHTCHLSSSIFYGGQDIYPQTQSSQNASFNSLYNNYGGEDDSEMATRGDWWQGGLYY